MIYSILTYIVDLLSGTTVCFSVGYRLLAAAGLETQMLMRLFSAP